MSGQSSLQGKRGDPWGRLRMGLEPWREQAQGLLLHTAPPRVQAAPALESSCGAPSGQTSPAALQQLSPGLQ